MRLAVLPICFLALGLLAPPPALHAQSALVGRVRADSTRRPLAGADILIEGTNHRTTTDTAGRYLLSGIPAGIHTVLVRLVGFRPVRSRLSLQTGDTTRFDPLLVGETVQRLDSLTVTGRLPGPRGSGREGFEERRLRGFGRFIDSVELRRSEHRTVGDLLRGTQGVNLVRFRECTGTPQRCGRTELRAASGRGQSSIFRGAGRDDYCWMSVMLDGHWLYQSESGKQVPDFSRDIRVADLDMIEKYRSAAETPGEYSGSATACGVIILWWRRGR